MRLKNYRPLYAFGVCLLTQHLVHSELANVSVTDSATEIQEAPLQLSSSVVSAPTGEVEAVDLETWRQLGPEESVPRGSHVSINMTSGEKFIKLTPEELELKSIASNLDPNPATDVEEIQRVLSSLPEPDDSIKDILSTASALRESNPAEFERLLKETWAKRQKEIKEASDAIVDETTLIKNLLLSLVDLNTPENMKTATKETLCETHIRILQDLEEMVQQIDNANDFVTLGGLETLSLLLNLEVTPGSVEKSMKNVEDLESCHWEIYSNVFFVLGTVVKNNPEGQLKALEVGLGAKLLRSFSMSNPHKIIPNRHLLVPEIISELSNKALYALGALFRGSLDSSLPKELMSSPNFPLFTELVRFFDNENDQVAGARVSKKALNLIYDIVNEVTHSEKHKLETETLSYDAMFAQRLGIEMSFVCDCMSNSLKRLQTSLEQCGDGNSESEGSLSSGTLRVLVETMGEIITLSHC